VETCVRSRRMRTARLPGPLVKEMSVVVAGGNAPISGQKYRGPRRVRAYPEEGIREVGGRAPESSSYEAF
jgi:hypothetical protein